MSRKDFQLIADTVAASTVTANLTDIQREDLALTFALKLRHTNERFDGVRFLVACGVEKPAATKLWEQR